MGVVTPVGQRSRNILDEPEERRQRHSSNHAFDTIGLRLPDRRRSAQFRSEELFSRIQRTSGAPIVSRSWPWPRRKWRWHDSGIDLEKVDRDRFGVIVSSGIGGLKTLEDQHTILLTKGPSRVSAFTIPMLISNMASGLISMEFGLRGPNMCIVTACATSNNAIGESWRMIKFGDADIFLAGGSEASIIPIGLAGFSAMKALSTRNDEPERASRPFDRDRDGFVMGEGAGVVVVEELEHAKARGAKIYCELAGYGLSARRLSHDGAAARWRRRGPRDEDGARPRRHYPPNSRLHQRPRHFDRSRRHLRNARDQDCFRRAREKRFRISSTKSMTGHLLGGAGAVEMAACALAIRDGVIPPTINLENPDAECDLDYTPHKAREKKVRVALNNSFGFGGHNATLVVKEFTS